jgi:hypothetical protein
MKDLAEPATEAFPWPGANLPFSKSEYDCAGRFCQNPEVIKHQGKPFFHHQKASVKKTLTESASL